MGPTASRPALLDPPRVSYFPELRPADFGLGRKDQVADEVAQGAPGILLVWRSLRSLVVTYRDTRLPRFEEAATHLEAKGWPLSVRATGGGAFPVGPGTIQMAVVMPMPGDAVTIEALYEAFAVLIAQTLATFGVSAKEEGVAKAFCPGRHDIAVQGRKIAGTSQHWRQGRAGRCIIVAASIIADEDPQVLSDVVNEFYRRAGGSFHCEPSAVTSLRQALSCSGAPTSNLTGRLIDRLIDIVESDRSALGD